MFAQWCAGCDDALNVTTRLCLRLPGGATQSATPTPSPLPSPAECAPVAHTNQDGELYSSYTLLDTEPVQSSQFGPTSRLGSGAGG
jgi:hypothetical protein